MVAQTIEIAGRRMVILEEADYLQLRRGHRADGKVAPMPARNRQGRRPAAALILASIAREIVMDRKAVKLSQQELAKRAGIRQETPSRIESGKHTPTMRTLQKIDRVLAKT